MLGPGLRLIEDILLRYRCFKTCMLSVRRTLCCSHRTTFGTESEHFLATLVPKYSQIIDNLGVSPSLCGSFGWLVLCGPLTPHLLRGLLPALPQVVVIFGAVCPMVVPVGLLAIAGRTYADQRLIEKGVLDGNHRFWEPQGARGLPNSAVVLILFVYCLFLFFFFAAGLVPSALYVPLHPPPLSNLSSRSCEPSHSGFAPPQVLGNPVAVCHSRAAWHLVWSARHVPPVL